MKIICEYCGSYVEPTESGNCPNCTASLGDSIKIQQERIKKEAEEKERKEEEKRKTELEQAHRDKEEEQLFDFGKEIVRTVIGIQPRRRSLFSRVRSKSRSLAYRFKRTITRCLIVVGVIFIVYLVIKYGQFSSFQEFFNYVQCFFA